MRDLCCWMRYRTLMALDGIQQARIGNAYAQSHYPNEHHHDGGASCTVMVEK